MPTGRLTFPLSPALERLRQGAPPELAGRSYTLAVGAATLLSLFLCLIRLDRLPFYTDEVYSAFISTRGIQHELEILYHRELNMGLYYLLLRPFAAISTQEWWLRVPSVTFDVAAVPLTAAVARRAAGPRAGALAAVFISLSPFALSYGRFARSYS